MKKILLLGAKGVFGSRLAGNLARVEGVSILLASRSLHRARALVKRLAAEMPIADLLPIAVSREALAQALNDVKPWLVIDASGPFQGADYAVPLLALSHGCHFMDLGDARDYLLGFSAAVNGVASSRGLVALAGVSSSPALSSAVVACLTQNWQRIDTVDMAITPDGKCDVGESVVRGVMSYAGHDIPQYRFGALQKVKGWMRGHAINLPGLGRRWVTPVETIEADVFPAHFNVASRVAFHAGLESTIEMRGIDILAHLRRRGWCKNISSLVMPFIWGRKLTRIFGGGHGGMIVRVAGRNAENKWTQAQWSLLAHDGKGPHVPGLPVVAAVRMMLAGSLKAGGRIACAEIPLSHIEAEFAHLPITTASTSITPDRAIFDDALSPEDMAQLPKAIADFHSGELAPVWRGEAQIDRGRGLLSRLVGNVIGLPEAAVAAPVQVTVEREADGTERWTRNFSGKQFHSTMNRGPDNTFWERFGPMNFRLKLRVENGYLFYPIAKSRFFGLPLPGFLLPSTQAFETVDAQGRFVFDVRISLPIGGLLVHYRGWLEPKRLK